MKFRNPNQDPKAKPIRVTSTSGHIAEVGAAWRELPEVLHAKAMSMGCECDKTGVDPNPMLEASDDAMQTGDELAHIKSAIKTLLIENDPDSFNDEGVPTVEAVSKAVGFTADKGDIFAVWETLKAEATETRDLAKPKLKPAGKKA